MNPHVEFPEWLRAQLTQSCIQPVFAAIFGSVGRKSPNPNDCDLLLVLERPTNQIDWRPIAAEKKGIRTRFLDTWRISLSITILTLAEAGEDTAFVRTVFRRELIPIIGSLDLLFSTLRERGLVGWLA